MKYLFSMIHNFQKICKNSFANYQNTANCELQMANSNPVIMYAWGVVVVKKLISTEIKKNLDGLLSCLNNKINHLHEICIHTCL